MPDFNQLLVEALPWLKVVAGQIYKQDADDAFQFTCLKAIKSKHSFKTGDDIRPWLRVILGQYGPAKYRIKNQRWTMLSEVRFNDAPCRGEVATKFSEDMEYALNTLDARTREMVLMHFVDDCSYQEIACKFRIPIGTVCSRIYRARYKLLGALRGRNYQAY